MHFVCYCNITRKTGIILVTYFKRQLQRNAPTDTCIPDRFMFRDIGGSEYHGLENLDQNHYWLIDYKLYRGGCVML